MMNDMWRGKRISWITLSAVLVAVSVCFYLVFEFFRPESNSVANGPLDSQDRLESLPRPGILMNTRLALPKIPDCRFLGIIGGDKCYDYKAIHDGLRQAPLAYNRPDKMLLGRRAEVSLVIDATDVPDPAAALRGLDGTVVEGTTKISLTMSAGLDGAAFKVEPDVFQEKMVTPATPTRWTWFVTPIEADDDKAITLDVYTYIEDGKDILLKMWVRSYRDQIFVDVTTWDYVVSMAKDLTPVHAFGVALFGTLSGVAALAWRRFSRKPKSATRTGARRNRATAGTASKTSDSGSVLK